MKEAGLVLVHGLFVDPRANAPGVVRGARGRRATALAEHGGTLGLRDHEWVDGGRRRLANRLSRIARGTAPAVDAVEIVELDEATLCASLADRSVRTSLQELAACAMQGFDPARSFVLLGAPSQLLEGAPNGQRVLWFGYGSSRLREAEFVEHYTRHHGPLVASHGPLLGLRRYRHVPNEQAALGESLRRLGLGQGPSPAVFAELFIDRWPLDLTSLPAQRAALREIREDERQHIDFRRSMLLLA